VTEQRPIACTGIAGDHDRCTAAPSFRVWGLDSQDGALSCARHLPQVVRFESQGKDVRVRAYEPGTFRKEQQA
jgi:hypothetical protein